MGINGDNAQQVTAGDNAEFQARWSPDGKHIIFQSEVYGTNATGGVATTGNIYYLGVIPANGKQYAFKRTGPTGSGGSTVTGVVADEGVIELKSKNTRNSDTLYDVAAYDMNWR
jgi:Tol biopolymer transport system component